MCHENQHPGGAQLGEKEEQAMMQLSAISHVYSQTLGDYFKSLMNQFL